MKAVLVCHQALMKLLVNGDAWRYTWSKQDKGLQVTWTSTETSLVIECPVTCAVYVQMKNCKKDAFTEDIAAEWLEKCPDKVGIDRLLEAGTLPPAAVRCYSA